MNLQDTPRPVGYLQGFSPMAATSGPALTERECEWLSTQTALPGAASARGHKTERTASTIRAPKGAFPFTAVGVNEIAHAFGAEGRPDRQSARPIELASSFASKRFGPILELSCHRQRQATACEDEAKCHRGN
jgi:hypothetical protein